MLIDFHTHILPKIDDGSRNIEMSLNMLAAQREQQVDEIVVTPQFLCTERFCGRILIAQTVQL